MNALTLVLALLAAPTWEITAYTADCRGCSGITASGRVPAPGTASCPRRFAFGQELHVEGIGTVTCWDRGGAIRGNRLDLFMTTRSAAIQWGRQQRRVTTTQEGGKR